MITYVDTSTLIKLLIDEVGTIEAGLIWDEPDVLVSARIGHVEARADWLLPDGRDESPSTCFATR